MLLCVDELDEEVVPGALRFVQRLLRLGEHRRHVVVVGRGLEGVPPFARRVHDRAALAVARLAIAIPLSPSGLGFQEGALSALFVGIGLSPATALAALLLARVSLLTTAIAGAVAFGTVSGVSSPRGRGAIGPEHP